MKRILVVSMVLLFIYSPSAGGFLLSPDRILKMAIYLYDSETDRNRSPNSITWNVTSHADIKAFLNTVNWQDVYDCSGLGLKAEAIIYFMFSDGTVISYEYMPEYLNRAGLPGMCREVNEQGHGFIESKGQ
jgi:hypothetical protein